MTDSHPSSWFEPLYAKAQGDAGQVPWATLKPNPRLREWLDQNRELRGAGTALVVGCGLGDDAQLLAKRGYQVTAFDISESAIAWCQERFAEGSVTFQVADLFDLPPEWLGAFDLVFESITLQALPLDVRRTALAQVAQLVKPQGTLLVATYLRPTAEPPQGPPWPLTLEELAQFEALGLEVIVQQPHRKRDSAFQQRIFMEYRAPEKSEKK